MKPKPAIFAASIFLAALRPAGAAEADQKRKELDEVRTQLEQKKREVMDYQRLQEEAERDLSRLKVEKEQARRGLSALNEKRRSAEIKKASLSERLAALTMAQGRGARILEGEIDGYARHLLAQTPRYGRSELWEESFRRAAIREKTTYLARLRVFEAQTSDARDKALRANQDLNRRATEAKALLRSRQDRYQRKETVYREAKDQLSRTMKEIRELEDSARALASLIRTLENRKAVAGKEPAGKEPPVPRYSLPWPVAGRVVRRFGKERVAELKTWVINNGIEIETKEGAEVQPVEDGKVIFAGPFRSYGNVIIVDHGRSFYSIYGQLREFLKRKGDRVNTGAGIATVGASSRGESSGLLYFELRQGQDAVDPVLWLKK